MARRFVALTWLAGAVFCAGSGGCVKPSVPAQAEVTGQATQRAESGDRLGRQSAAPAGDVGGIAFEEVAARSGVRYRWPRQPRPVRNLEAFGSGCAFVDYDHDGWQDILLVGEPTIALYRNKRDGTFEDVSAVSGLTKQRGQWKGCAVGDYDGDGFVDFFITGYRCLAMLKNQAGKSFSDVTRSVGLDPHNRQHWGSSAGFMDLDGNGTLDLVLCNYVVFGPKEPQYCEMIPGVRSGCPPQKYRPEFPELWKNVGGRFTDATVASGLSSVHGKALVVAFNDVDGDGRMDIYIGNDGLPAELMRNMGQLRFQNVGVQSGVAFSMTAGRPIAAMGADWGDYDGDGQFDLVVTAFSDEPYSMLRHAGKALFEHTGDKTGIAGPTLKPLGFGAKWLDVDNDGWMDVIFANGHVYDKADEIDPFSPYRQPLMLFHNQPGRAGQSRKFLDIAGALGAAFTAPIVGRGLATADYDNDGRTDVLVVDYEGAPLLLHNQSQTGNHWLIVNLKGRGGNRFAYGATIEARAGKHVWVGQVSPASSYLSSSEARVHLGLGKVRRLDSVRIRWPAGKAQMLRDVAADQVLSVMQAPA